MRTAFDIIVGAVQAIGAVIGILIYFGMIPSSFHAGSAPTRSPVVWLLFALLATSIATLGVGVYRLRYTQPPFDSETPLTIVAGKTFRNERVELDGKEFRNCTFMNVKLVYNGRARAALIRNEFVNPPVLTSDNPAIDVAASLIIGVQEMGGAPVKFVMDPK